jgi:hypothetical protein
VTQNDDGQVPATWITVVPEDIARDLHGNGKRGIRGQSVQAEHRDLVRQHHDSAVAVGDLDLHRSRKVVVKPLAHCAIETRHGFRLPHPCREL